ncbi:MAG: hypothetical protein NZ949_01630 [Candidatus Kapabacteria bacterium]|nr:hypothetical protein [Candidatus Kapabacteria bacterium]MDW7996188.1 hypothetical protein [Bacteroidota bacterium]
MAMDLFGQRELSELILYQGEPPYLSLYIPTERVTSEAHQNPVRFRNILRRAHEELLRWGASPSAIQRIIGPLEELAEREVYWLYQSDGLAVFAAQDYAQTYRLPWRFREEVFVGESFVVAPLVPLFLGNGQFLVLALEKYRVRLYGGGPTGLTEIEREGLPLDLWKALQVDVPEPIVQYRTGLRLGRSRTHMATHGHGYGRENLKRLMAEYYRMVDRALTPLGNERHLPLVLAGVEYEVALYRDISHYPVLVPEAVYGNPESYSLSELHAHVRKILVRWSDLERQQWLERFWGLRGNNPKASEELSTVFFAAIQGRAEVLFIRPDVELWGIADRLSQRLEIVPPGTPGATHLLNEAVINAFVMRTRTFAVSADELPADVMMAAILRY